MSHNAPIPFGLYIHWPFCRSKCPYCDFNSHVRQSIDDDVWKNALLTEMRTWAARTPHHRLQTIFFGGGTPSLMPPATVAALINEARRLWPSVNDLEITLEANPTSVEAENFVGYASAGVNRVSLGVQSLIEDDLKFLGRQHSASEAKAAIALAAKYFPRYSFDLIYARPKQTIEAWRKELEEALTLAPEHISLYQLTIEPNTGFAQQYARGAFQLPKDEIAGELYDVTGEMLNARGFRNYEISNYAKPGAECRHNLIYWNYDDYIGIGAGAHGRVRIDDARYATSTARLPERWLNDVTANGHALIENNALTLEDAQQESILMGLRLQDGIDRTAWAEKFGKDILAYVPAQNIEQLVASGDIAVTEKHLAATTQGRLRLNAVLNWLLA